MMQDKKNKATVQPLPLIFACLYFKKLLIMIIIVIMIKIMSMTMTMAMAMAMA